MLAAAAAGGPLTRSRIEAFDQTADVLSQAAGHLLSGAQRLQRVTTGYVEQIHRPNGSDWQGKTATHYFAEAQADQLAVFPAIDHAKAMAEVAECGAEYLRGARAAALAAIVQAEDDDFSVGEDLSVSDDYVWEAAADRAARQQAAVAHRDYIAHCGAPASPRQSHRPPTQRWCRRDDGHDPPEVATANPRIRRGPRSPPG